MDIEYNIFLQYFQLCILYSMHGIYISERRNYLQITFVLFLHRQLVDLIPLKYFSASDLRDLNN